MTKAFFIVTTFFLTICRSQVAIAQEWTVYTTADGLVENSISMIQEDTKGYLWFMSDFDGVSRFGGVRFQNFDSANGLPSNNIYYTFADREGNFWFATDRGVSRHDGQHFKNLTVADGLAGNFVTFILQDRENHLWFATDQGISDYDGTTFINYTTVDEIQLSTVTFILEDRQNILWFATTDGIFKYDGKAFQVVANRNDLPPVHIIFEDGQGNLWFGAEDGVYQKRGNDSALAGPLIPTDVSSIVEDALGNLWFASTSLGVIEHEFDTSRFIMPRELADKTVYSMLADTRGEMWFGTDVGITGYNGEAFENFTQINGKQFNSVRCIWQDRDGNLWFGTENGLLKNRLNNLWHYTENDGLINNSVKVVIEGTDETLWLGTEKGVSYYDGEAFHDFKLLGEDQSVLSMLQDSKGILWIGTTGTLYKNSNPFRENKTLTAVRSMIEEESGNLWFATASGVVFYDGRLFRSFPVENSREMLLDSKGRLWIGTWDSGIYKYDGADSLTNYTMADGLGSNHVTWILESQNGDLWFGLRSGISPSPGARVARGGLCRFDGHSFENFTRDDGLISDVINVALEDNEGYLWLGTDNGVMKCESLIVDDSLRVETITRANGLLSNYVASIYLDRSGNFWFGTDKGVSKFDGENFQNILLEEDFGFGFVKNIFEDINGAIWLTSTNSGVIKYTPPAKEVHPRILITQIEADKIYSDNFDSIRVPSNRRVSFEYTAISFKTNPEIMRFQYMLEGYDSGWRPSTYERRVHYEDLIAKNYKFKVRAIDEDLHYSSPPASIDISVFQPFYLTTLFMAIMILTGIVTIGGTGYLIVQVRSQRRIAASFREKLQLQKEAERVQAAKMESLSQLVAGVAHEINTPIGAITGNNDVISRAVAKIKDNLGEERNSKNPENEHLLKAFAILENTNQASILASERIAKIVTNLRRFVRLDEAERQTADVHEGLNSATALLEAELGGRIVFKREYGDIPKIYCSPTNLNQAFMAILKNAVDAIKDNGEIKIKTAELDENLRIEISDDGTGIPQENIARIFDPGFTTKGVKVGVGLGLSICYKIIVDEHRGHIDVSSKPDKGTTFTINLPIHFEANRKA